MSSITNIQLKALRKGDIKMFGTIYEQFYEMLYYYALTFNSVPEIAEEFTQEAFLMLWERRKQFSDDFNLKAYLFKSIHNQALNFIRHQKVVQAHLQIQVPNALVEEKPVSEPWLEEALKVAISSLPERTRQVFILSRIDGLKHKEIAEQLGITEKTVEVQVRKARLSLQKKLKRFYKEI